MIHEIYRVQSTVSWVGWESGLKFQCSCLGLFPIFFIVKSELHGGGTIFPEPRTKLNFQVSIQVEFPESTCAATFDMIASTLVKDKAQQWGSLASAPKALRSRIRAYGIVRQPTSWRFFSR